MVYIYIPVGTNVPGFRCCFVLLATVVSFATTVDQGYGRGGTPIFTGVFEPLARVALYPTDEDGSKTWFAAA